MYFMDGVILIEKITKWSTIANILIGAVLIVFAIAMLGGCRLVFSSYRYAQPDAVKSIGIILAAIGLIATVALNVSMHNEEQFNQLLADIGWGLLEDTGKYKVTVTNDVDMNEFMDRYEIVDYDNGAYIIKAK